MSPGNLLARCLADGFAGADPGLSGPHLLSRVQLADGLALHVGRDAVIAWLAGLCAAFEDRTARLVAEAEGHEMVAVALALGGTPVAWPGLPAAASPAPGRGRVELLQHLWIATEGGRAVMIEAVTDWFGLAGAAGIDASALAGTIGSSHPCQRPLGELASGRGQLVDTGEDLAARFNRRRLSGVPPLVLAGGGTPLVQLVADLPDARLTEDRALDGAGLWRLQGHVAGRRVSLPVSRIGDGPMLWDRLAVAASAHRPFWPD